MYDLKKAKDDFPWTRVIGFAPVEPWRKDGSGWFDDIPAGWGDIIHAGLIKIDKLLNENEITEHFNILQVKEKWGGLRFYYGFEDQSSKPDKQLTDVDIQKVYDEIADIIMDMEEATEKVCCYCGTSENVKQYGSWIHYACEPCEKKGRESNA